MSPWIVWLDSRDERLLVALVERRRRTLDPFFRAVTHLADPAAAIALAGGLGLGMVPSVTAAGVHACATLALSHLLVEIVKRTVVRPRPSLPIGLESLVRSPDHFSFPSGHAAAGLAIALPLAMGMAAPWGIGVLCLGLLVGVSRCYLGVHYPGDVLAGWLLATSSALAAACWLA